MAYDGLPFLVASAHMDAPALVRQMRKLARRPVEHAASRPKAEQVWRSRSDWAGVVADVSLTPATADGLEFIEATRRDAPPVPTLLVAEALTRDSVNRAATLGATLVWSPAPLDIVGAFMRRAMTARALGHDAGLDPRVAVALDAELLMASPRLTTVRAAELLRLAVAGLTREEMELAMGIGTDCYAYHVRKLLRGTRTPDLQTLVLRVMRGALRLAPVPAQVRAVAGAADDRDLSGIRDRRTGLWVEPAVRGRGSTRGR